MWRLTVEGTRFETVIVKITNLVVLPRTLFVNLFCRWSHIELERLYIC